MHKFSYLIFNILFSCYSLLSFIVPLKLWVLFGKFLGTILFYLSKKHKKITLINLNFVFDKTKTQKEIKQIAKRNFQGFGMFFQEFVRLKYLKSKSLEKLIEIEKIENLQKAKANGKGVILLSAHFGNWEYGSSLYGSKINRLNFFVKKIPNPHIEKLRVRINNKFNLNVLYKEVGLISAVKKLQKGQDLLILPDQNANLKTGVRSFFLGKEIASLKIVATLSMKFDIPVVPFFMIRQKDKIHHKMVFLPELNFNGTIEENIQLQNNVIEEYVGKYPDHWLWLHRKWLYLYPDIYGVERYHNDFPVDKKG